jgi:hypothetical protein
MTRVRACAARVRDVRREKRFFDGAERRNGY